MNPSPLLSVYSMNSLPDSQSDIVPMVYETTPPPHEIILSAPNTPARSTCTSMHNEPIPLQETSPAYNSNSPSGTSSLPMLGVVHATSPPLAAPILPTMTDVTSSSSESHDAAYAPCVVVPSVLVPHGHVYPGSSSMASVHVGIVSPIVGASHTEMPPPVPTSGANLVSPGSDQFYMRRRRRTRAELASAASNLVTTVPAELVTCRRCRTCAEMTVAASSSRADLLIPGPAPLVTHRARRTHAQMAAVASSSGARLSTIVARPHNEASVPISSSGINLTSSGADQISEQRRRSTRTTQLVPPAMVSSAAPTTYPIERGETSVSVRVSNTSSGPDVMPYGSGQIVRRRRGRPRKPQLVTLAMTSVAETIIVPVERGMSSMSPPAAISVVNDGVSTCGLHNRVPSTYTSPAIESAVDIMVVGAASSTPTSARIVSSRHKGKHIEPAVAESLVGVISLTSAPARAVSSRHKRTRIEIEVDAHTPARSRHPSSRLRSRRSPVYKGLGMSYIPSSIIALPILNKCKYCDATKFAFERPTLCCGKGSISLAQIEIPSELLDLFMRQDATGVHFRQYSRSYNNNFAFSCLGGNITPSNAKGFFTFSLQGQIYHFIPNLLVDSVSPKFLQLYFFDGSSEVSSRCNTQDKLRPDLVELLIHMTSTNPYASFFRSLRTFPITECSEIQIFKNPALDQRVYNAPSCDEVAAIIVDDSSYDRINSPHILVYGKADHEHRIMHYYGCYDPLQYPLLFTRGESGWHQGLKCVKPGSRRACNELPFPIVPTTAQTAADIIAKEAEASTSRAQTKGKNVSCRQYYAYRFQIRPRNYIINTGRIFLQYIVDMYVKVENTRLDFLKKNQTLLRSDLYQGIVDSVNDGTRTASDIGRRVILPASFIGGPRDMKCRYPNAMALVQKFGKPDLFMTMTCNPNWHEIKENLSPGEGPEHRPDLVARIFNAKVRLLKKLICEKKIFGPIDAIVDVIEFQKRGLPHLHMLLILAPGSKIRNPESFDQYVCAELPSVEFPRLRSLVLQHMMHGPCGDKWPNCSCMEKVGLVTKCKSDYPKEYAEFTTCTNDSYPIYRRRCNGDVVTVRRAELDNRWVVPYNPYLLSAFDCHINVEICSTIKAVKYIYKYVYKGHDKVCFDIARNQNNVGDEITSYQSGRWISAPESAWRIFRFDLYSMRPAVIPLQVHLPHMHVVSFSTCEDLQNIVNNENRSVTMLTGYFTANCILENAKRYLYSEFPLFFTWDGTLKAWKERKGPECVGRLTYVSPCEGERYYLRLLLANIRGATSFKDLLTYDGNTYTRFKDVAEKYSLLETDAYAEACMHEAVEIQMPCALRRLFATLLIFCDSTNPRRLWDQFYPSLSEDFAHTYKNQLAKVLYLTYSEVDKYLEGLGRNMEYFNLHGCISSAALGLRPTRDISDALDAPIPPQYINAYMSLNVEQRLAYDAIMKHVEKNIPGAFFIDGPGGTGKTFLYCALYATIRSLGKIVLPTATSGIAASNMPTGRTAHSRFKIPIAQDGLVTCNVSKQSSLASLLRVCTLIIWDESSMAKKEDIEALDRLLQDICDSKMPFGGKIIVFGGDFRQVLPVVPRKSQIEIVNSSLVSSYLWPQLLKFKLCTNIRAKEDIEFANFLLDLGNGSLQTCMHSSIQLPPIISCYDVKDMDFDLLIEVMFPEMNTNTFNSSIFNDRAILTPTNEDVDSINAALISKFIGSSCTYKSYDSVIDDNCNLYPAEFLHTLCPSGMSPHELVLKKGCPVILLRNLDPSNGLCNGTRLICKEFRRDVILCEISTGYYKGTQVFIPRINLRPPATTYPFQFERKHFPIKLCFAMTINKSQGQTLEKVCVYLRQPCFSHGQLYVAFSRARKSINLKVFLVGSVDTESSTNDVINIVSFDILERAGVIITT